MTSENSERRGNHRVAIACFALFAASSSLLARDQMGKRGMSHRPSRLGTVGDVRQAAAEGVASIITSSANPSSVRVHQQQQRRGLVVASSAGSNLLPNPGFETGGTAGWIPFAGSVIEAQSSEFRSGSSAALVSGRTTGTYQGIAVDVRAMLTVGATYAVSGWFKLESGAGSDKILATVLRKDGDAGGTAQYLGLGSSTVTDAGWTKVEGLIALDPPANAADSIFELMLYFEGPSLGVNFYIDDVVVAEQDPANLLDNPGFEDGLANWASYGGSTISVQTVEKLNGAVAVLVDGRTNVYDGVGTNLLGKMSPGSSYTVSAWCKLASGASSANLFITMRQVDGGGTSYVAVGSRTQQVTDGGWAKVEGDFTLSAQGTVTELTLYFEGPDLGVGFYLDDVRVVSQGDWKADADASIEQIRKRDANIHVVDIAGAPISNAQVDVQQLRRHFAFGTAISKRLNTDSTYQNFVRDNFEWAVPENEAKWYDNEPSRGSVSYADMDAMYAFCEANDIKVRGHTVAWAVETYVQDWVKSLSDADLTSALASRVSSVVGQYKDKFLHWDVNNEMLHGSYFQDRLGSSIRHSLFTQVKAADPNVLTFVNDYNIITSLETSAYKQQIQDLQGDGAIIDGIGVQGHFGSSVDPYAVKSRLDSLAELNLPIWISEYDTANADADLRADALERLYRTAFAHPAVEGVLMWGFWAGAHWRGADAALVDLDWTVNAAGLRYQGLMNEWTTSESGLMTDATGDAPFRGYHGKYQITVTIPGGSPSVHEVYLSPDEGGAGSTAATFNITLDSSPTTSAPSTAQPSSMPLQPCTACAKNLGGESCQAGNNGEDCCSGTCQRRGNSYRCTAYEETCSVGQEPSSPTASPVTSPPVACVLKGEPCSLGTCCSGCQGGGPNAGKCK